MKKTKLLVLMLAALTASACSAAKTQQPVVLDAGHRTIAEGYSLLYAITSQQKEMKKLLLIKLESDPVDKVISDIADYTGELSAELEDMAKRYPALTVEKQFLPTVEVKTRESLTSATTKQFLDTSGKDFERRLLLKQLTALEQEQHMAKVMVELETADERRTFWRGVERRFGELHRDVEGLLEREYFCG